MNLDQPISGVLAELYPGMLLVFSWSSILKSGNLGIMNEKGGRNCLNYIYNKYTKTFDLLFWAPEDRYHLNVEELIEFFREKPEIEKYAEELYFINLVVLDLLSRNDLLAGSGKNSTPSY